MRQGGTIQPFISIFPFIMILFRVFWNDKFNVNMYFPSSYIVYFATSLQLYTLFFIITPLFTTLHMIIFLHYVYLSDSYFLQGSFL